MLPVPKKNPEVLDESCRCASAVCQGEIVAGCSRVVGAVVQR